MSFIVISLRYNNLILVKNKIVFTDIYCFMFSNSLKYAIKALSYLAKHSHKGTRFGVAFLAEQIVVPTPYLKKIMQKLAKENFVTSIKGPNGGFYLSSANKREVLKEVIFKIDGGDKFKNCILNFENCDLNDPCPLHEVYSPYKNGFLAEMMSKSIGDLG